MFSPNLFFFAIVESLYVEGGGLGHRGRILFLNLKLINQGNFIKKK